MERHHPAGRRKAAFCFYILLHSDCHRRVHDNPKWAEECGLLAKGRNSKELTIDYATELVRLMPFPPLYCIPILTKYQSL